MQIDFSTLTAIVADKNQSMRGLLKNQLLSIGMETVATSSSVSDLRRKLKAAPAAIVLCDLYLDDNDGAFLDALRVEGLLDVSTVFVLVTGDRAYKSVELAAEYAPDDCLIKPFNPSTLARRLKSALIKKEAFQQVHQLIDTGYARLALMVCATVPQKYRLDVLRLRAELHCALLEYDQAINIYAALESAQKIPWSRLGYSLMQSVLASVDNPTFKTVYDAISDQALSDGDLAKAITAKEKAVAISVGNKDKLKELQELQNRNHRYPTLTLAQALLANNIRLE